MGNYLAKINMLLGGEKWENGKSIVENKYSSVYKYLNLMEPQIYFTISILRTIKITKKEID